MDLKARLKAELWLRFGDKNSPGEWDGNVLGGGKLSQRFWEYFQAIEMLDLTPDSVVLDIGGGSPVTGAGFFAATLARHVKQVHIMDVSIKDSLRSDNNIIYHRQLATYDNLCALFKAHPEITHVACLSVFEHIEPTVRVGIVRGINDAFTGDTFVSTLEYHTRKCFFEHQLTAATLSDLFKPMTRFYLDAIEKSPVYAMDAYETGLKSFDFKTHTLMLRIGWYLRLFGLYKAPWETYIPAWYPLALKFVKLPES
ncbi:MAG: hypothetical protein LV480_13785 [Methylacidiphilales bacterium]|nr:hypothetical protein [Candidatus Methylacidiphilales bacterium]